MVKRMSLFPLASLCVCGGLFQPPSRTCAPKSHRSSKYVQQRTSLPVRHKPVLLPVLAKKRAGGNLHLGARKKGFLQHRSSGNPTKPQQDGGSRPICLVGVHDLGETSLEGCEAKRCTAQHLLGSREPPQHCPHQREMPLNHGKSGCDQVVVTEGRHISSWARKPEKKNKDQLTLRSPTFSSCGQRLAKCARPCPP